MKTIDEAAEDNQFQGDHGTYEYDAIELHDMLTDRFKAGVEFAQLFRLVEEVPIPLDEIVLVTLEDGSITTCTKHEQFALVGDHFEWDRPKIVSWRPINFK